MARACDHVLSTSSRDSTFVDVTLALQQIPVSDIANNAEKHGKAAHKHRRIDNIKWHRAHVVPRHEPWDDYVFSKHACGVTSVLSTLNNHTHAPANTLKGATANVAVVSTISSLISLFRFQSKSMSMNSSVSLIYSSVWMI